MTNKPTLYRCQICGKENPTQQHNHDRKKNQIRKQLIKENPEISEHPDQLKREINDRLHNNLKGE